MTQFRFIKKFILVLLPFVLLAQPVKENLTKLSYKKLTDLYFDNENNPIMQMRYTNAYMQKANSENNPIRKARANYQIALLYYKSDKNKAIQYLDSVIKYSKNSNDKFFPAAAYCEKADFLKREFKFNQAIVNYKLAEKIARKTNIDYYYVVREYIGIIKSENLQEYKEALEIYKECYNYYKTKDFRSEKYAPEYQSIIFGIADCYKSLNQTDSTTFYNKLGYRESIISKNEKINYLFVLNEGANQVLKKNYKAAIDSISKALPKVISNKDKANELASYFYFGKAYKGLNKNDQAAKNFIIVDSIYNQTKEITAEFIDGYPFLIKYYKEKGDKENQLKYITKYMFLNNILQKNYRNLNKLIGDQYDVPHLISEKENLIESLKNDKTKSYWTIGLLFIIIISSAGFGVYQYQQKKRYRFHFEEIMKKKTESNYQKENTLVSSGKKVDIGINEELIQQILDKLKHFEETKGFLNPGITIQSLSDTFHTNTKYVSKIVNIYKEKTFIQYINDLRVEYALYILKTNSKLQKYTIQALSLEFGFNNAESFSTAFFKKTGIKPAYFIKELEELRKKTNN